MNKAYKNDYNHDRLWKMRAPFYLLVDNCGKLYSLSGHLAVDEAKWRVIFKHYIPKNVNSLVKIYKL
jgi:hypothetical protein